MVKRFFSFSKHLTKVIDRVGKKKRKEKEKTKIDFKEFAKNNRVLMFGWELPPFNSGGLGVACYELASSLAKKETKVTFVLPEKKQYNIDFMDVSFADGGTEGTGEKIDLEKRNIDYKHIDSLLRPYVTSESYEKMKRKSYELLRGTKYKSYRFYGDDLIDEVHRYGEAARELVKKEEFTVIHAHDWLSIPAGIAAKQETGKPLIVQIHALEFDRSGETGANRLVCDIERAGVEEADKVIAVSQYTKDRIVKFYGIDPDKVEVVHNGIALNSKPKKQVSLKALKKRGKKIVLFVGRITFQKGVDYLIHAAKKVVEKDPDALFMVVGSGDMAHQIIDQTAGLGLSDKVYFPGFLRGDDLENIYRAADVYVMPSVSEPFGLVALEALSHKTPVIISKQSGVSEVVNHALKVDFWDTDELANKILAVLKNGSIKKTLAKNGHKEAKDCTWDKAADGCIRIYDKIV